MVKNPRGIIIPPKAANIPFPSHAAIRIGVAHSALIISRQTTDVVLSGHVACEIGFIHNASHIAPHQATDSPLPNHAADRIRLAHRAIRVTTSYQTPNVPVASHVSSGIGTAHIARLTSHQATHPVSAIPTTVPLR